MIKFKKAILSTMCLTMLIGGTSVFASSDTKNYQPNEKVIDGILYLDNVPLYTYEDVKSGKVSEDLHSGKLNVIREKSADSKAKNEWVLIGTTSIYQGHDTDRFNNEGATAVERTLTTTSETYYEVSGETGLGFIELAEAKIGGKVGEKWGKTISDKYKIPVGWVTEQKTACRVPVYSYKYVKEGIFGDTKYYAEAYGKDGTETWVYSNPIKK